MVVLTNPSAKDLNTLSNSHSRFQTRELLRLTSSHAQADTTFALQEPVKGPATGLGVLPCRTTASIPPPNRAYAKCGTIRQAQQQLAEHAAQGAVSVAASARLGKVIDLAWVPLPAPIGGGSVVVVAGEDGSLACVDATQTVEQRSPKRRLAAFKNLVGGRWPFPQVLVNFPQETYLKRFD